MPWICDQNILSAAEHCHGLLYFSHCPATNKEGGGSQTAGSGQNQDSWPSLAKGMSHHHMVSRSEIKWRWVGITMPMGRWCVIASLVFCLFSTSPLLSKQSFSQPLGFAVLFPFHWPNTIKGQWLHGVQLPTGANPQQRSPFVLPKKSLYKKSFCSIGQSI